MMYDGGEIEIDDGEALSAEAIGYVHHLLAVGQLERARAAAAQLIATDPEEVSALLAMVAVQIAIGDWDAALTGVDAAVAREPDNDEAHHLRAAVLLQLGRFREAEEAIREAIVLDPEWAEYRTAYARVLICCEVFAEALEQASLAMSLDPDDSDAHALYSNLLLLVPRSDLSLSEESARRAVQLDPEDADAHATLALAQLMAGRIDEAEARCRTALELDPTNPVALRCLIEATAAGSIAYRPMFKLSLWLERLGTGAALALLFGLWAVINTTSQLLDESPYAVYMNLAVVLYLAFCAYTWFSRPLTMLVLRRKHPWLRADV